MFYMRIFIVCLFVGLIQGGFAQEQATFKSGDGLEITADLYIVHKDKKTPLIVLCHQAGWSRGAYREIAPRLNKLGFNCIAVDQRSGKGVNGVKNETAARAVAAKKGMNYADAEIDVIAALKYARKNHAKGKLLAWGSSYSAGLVLQIAGAHPELVDGVLSFSPADRFDRFGKPKGWVTASAKNIKCPVFITSAKNEKKNWQPIFDAIPGNTKTSYLPETKGNHGSRSLWKKFDDNEGYWKAVESFLKANFK